MLKCEVQVYLDTGDVWFYEADAEKGREHAAEIVRNGFSNTVDDELTHWPPHRIRKVKVSGQSTSYPAKRKGI